MLAEDDERQDTLGRVLADPEDQPTTPRHPDEMGLPDHELVKHSHRIGDASPHGIFPWLVWLVAASESAMIDVDRPDLTGRQRLREVGLADVGDAIEKAAMQDDRDALTSIVLEVDTGAIEPIGHVGHWAPGGGASQSIRVAARRRGPLRRPAEQRRQEPISEP